MRDESGDRSFSGFERINTNAFADEKLNKVLDELKQIKKDIKVLEKAVYSQSFKGKGSSGTSGSLEGALTRQLVKITELEEQIQKLTASNEDTLFKMDQLTERLEKIQADNELRLSDLESGDPKKIAKMLAGGTKISTFMKKGGHVRKKTKKK